MADDPSALSATEAAARIRQGRLSAEALVGACLARIAGRDGDVRAWCSHDPEYALRQARALDRGPWRGPLHGIPVGVKDIMLTEDFPTAHNSPLYAGSHPRIDAACVSLLRSAGAVIMGKTDTVEFGATGRRARSRNPHDLSRTPGGSSSGSAAAVADRHVPLALGTQTGGSTIRPASFCGVWALKPTWGLVCGDGVKSYARSLDTVGWFARSAEDLRLVHDVYDPDPPQPVPETVTGLRMAVWRTPAWSRASAETVAAFDAAQGLLRAAGAVVEDLALPELFEALPATHLLIMRAEGRAAMLADDRAHPGALEPSLAAHVANVDGYTRSDLVSAYDRAAECRRIFDEIAAGYDAVLSPSALGIAPTGLQDVGDLAFNGMWTLLHAPSVNVPGWSGPGGLPVGLTIGGPRFGDRKAVAVAALLGRLAGLSNA